MKSLGYPGAMRARAAVAALLFVAGCNDVSAVRLNLVFESPETEAQVRWLQVVVREVTSDPARACDNFPNSTANGLDEGRSIVPYPWNQDILATNVDLTLYSQLTYIVLAYTSLEFDDTNGNGIDEPSEIITEPIAGSCDIIPAPLDDALRVDFLMVDLDGGAVP